MIRRQPRSKRTDTLFPYTTRFRSWLNMGQSLITNAALAGAMAYTVWGWSTGEYKVGDVVLVNTLLAQLFRPLDMLGMVYRVIRQGLIDMEAMFRQIGRAHV